MDKFYDTIARKTKLQEIRQKYKSYEKIIIVFSAVVFVISFYYTFAFLQNDNDLHMQTETICDVLSVETHNAHKKQYIVSLEIRPRDDFDNETSLIVVKKYTYTPDQFDQKFPCTVFYKMNNTKNIYIDIAKFNYNYDKFAMQKMPYEVMIFLSLCSGLLTLIIVGAFVGCLDSCKEREIKHFSAV